MTSLAGWNSMLFGFAGSGFHVELSRYDKVEIDAPMVSSH
jgi:hypothetical protein